MPNRTIRRMRGTRFSHRWVCPKCRNELPEQTMCLIGKPECNHGHTSTTMEPLIGG